MLQMPTALHRALMNVNLQNKFCEGGNLLKHGSVTDVDVVGTAESHCVKSTAVDPAKLGYRIGAFSDLTVGVGPQTIAAALVEMLGGGALVGPSQAARAEIERLGESDR
jgi:nicotinamidase-related amidase